MPSNFGRPVRDEYRPVRSPSPRGFRGRDNFRGRERSPARYYQGRSRSPHDRSRQFRSRSPKPTTIIDDEASLPIMRRSPREVPDVQIILVDEVDRFVVHRRPQRLPLNIRLEPLSVTYSSHSVAAVFVAMCYSYLVSLLQQ